MKYFLGIGDYKSSFVGGLLNKIEKLKKLSTYKLGRIVGNHFDFGAEGLAMHRGN